MNIVSYLVKIAGFNENLISRINKAENKKTKAEDKKRKSGNNGPQNKEIQDEKH